MKHVEEVKKNIEEYINDEIGLRVNVSLVEPQSLPEVKEKQLGL